MKVLFEARSTNGRWGLAVCGDVPENFAFPARGSVAKLGTIEGMETYRFTPDKSGAWIVVGGDVKPLAGCKKLAEVSLQNGEACIIAGGDFFAYTDYGYKRRSSELVALKDGQRVKLPAPVLLALGLIPSTEQILDCQPPCLDSPIADALRKAGIV